jgi:hypothetical protein
LNEQVYSRVNNGPYLVAGATTKEDYEALRHRMIETLRQLDQRLATSRFLFGGQVTEADVRLWPTLARFDTGYNPLSGISERPLTSFANLWRYARDLYRHPRSATPPTSPSSAACSSGLGHHSCTTDHGELRSNLTRLTGTHPPARHASSSRARRAAGHQQPS